MPAGTSRAYLAPRPLGELAHVVVVTPARRAARRPPGAARAADLRGPRSAARGECPVPLRRPGRVGAATRPGDDLRPPAWRRIEADVAVECELDPPAERVDVATFAARRLAEDLHAQLVERSSSCGRLRITARTEDGRELERTWRCDDGAMGGLTAARITDRVRWQLEGWLTASRVALGHRHRQEQRGRGGGATRAARMLRSPSRTCRTCRTCRTSRRTVPRRSCGSRSPRKRWSPPASSSRGCGVPRAARTPARSVRWGASRDSWVGTVC
ncbi:hypothetical protein NKG05_29560 [Oerskovia sp. M15]